jgi:hypothetical protein
MTFYIDWYSQQTWNFREELIISALLSQRKNKFINET